MPPSSPPDVERLVAGFRDRLRWRHLIVIAVAMLMAVTGLGGLLAAWVPSHGSPRLGTDSTRAGYTVLFGAIYLAAAVLGSYGIARFNIGRAIRRFPLVLLLSVVVLAVALLIGLLAELSGPHRAEGGGDSSSRTRGTQTADEHDKHAARAAENLACALVDGELAARVIGGALSDQDRVPSVTRNTQHCICRADGTENQLFVTVSEGRRADRRFRRIARRASPVAGVGDSALRISYHVGGHLITGIAARRDGWLVDATVRAVDPAQIIDEAALIELTRVALSRLAA